MNARPSWIALALFLAFVSVSASAQEGGGTFGPHAINAFAEFTSARSGQGVGFLWGGSAGTYVQRRFLGFGLRATEVPSGATVHLFDAVAGPRVAVSFPLLRAYLEAGGGMGHSGYYDQYGNYGSGWGAAWQADAGVSHALLPRLSWRVLEVGYGRIYTGPGVSPLFISTGLTVHVW